MGFISFLNLYRKKRVKLQSYKNFPPDFFGHPISINKKVTTEPSSSQLPICNTIKRKDIRPQNTTLSCEKVANETPSFRCNPFPIIDNSQQADQGGRSETRHRKNSFFLNQGHFGGKAIHTEMSIEEMSKENLSKSESHNGRIRFLPQTTRAQLEKKNPVQLKDFHSDKENSIKHASSRRKAALSLLEETGLNQNLFHGNSLDRVVFDNITKSSNLTISSPYLQSFCTKSVLSPKIPNTSQPNINEFKTLQSLLMNPSKFVQSATKANPAISRADRLYLKNLYKDNSQPYLPRVPSSDMLDFVKTENSISLQLPNHKKEHISMFSNFDPTNKPINNRKYATPIRAHPIIKVPEATKSQKVFLIPEHGVKRENSSEENHNIGLKSLIEKVVEQKKLNIQVGLQLSLKNQKEFEFSFSKKFFPEQEQVKSEEMEVIENNKALNSEHQNTAEQDIIKQNKVGPVARKKVVLRKKVI